MALDKIPVGHIRAIQNYLTIHSTSWTEAKVGSTALTARKWVHLFNRSGATVWYVYDNTLTVDNAFVLRSGGMIILPIADTVPVYLRGTTGSQKVIIAEVS